MFNSLLVRKYKSLNVLAGTYSLLIFPVAIMLAIGVYLLDRAFGIAINGEYSPFSVLGLGIRGIAIYGLHIWSKIVREKVTFAVRGYIIARQGSAICPPAREVEYAVKMTLIAFTASAFSIVPLGVMAQEVAINIGALAVFLMFAFIGRVQFKRLHKIDAYFATRGWDKLRTTFIAMDVD